MGKFLVSECIFKLFCHCESLRWWQICYACIAEKSLNRLLLLLILKSSNQRWSVKQGALKNSANFTGNHLRWSFLIIRSPEGLQRSSKETLTQIYCGEIYKVLKSTYFEEHLWTSACFCIFIGGFLYNAWKSCDWDLWWRFFAKTVNVF